MADVITRFKLETTQYDSKLRDASQALSQYARHASFAGKEFDKFTKNNADAARALGSISTSATNAKDKVKELVAAYNQAANAYNALTKEQQQSNWGKALAESINTLKGRITEAKQELYSLGDAVKNGKFGQFGGIIDGIGHKIGVTGNLTDMLTSKTALLTGAIGAGTTAVVAATKAWADYNSEIAKQQQITTVTTGLKGDDADRMTSAARALSKTYNVEFRDAINAANTLMSQFGKTGDEAIQLLRDGMQGMIMGDGPKLLQMIQQYAPAFQSAGVSASQLVAVIQNSEGGIFTDNNMQAIVMGISRLREMTKSTAEALQGIGVNADDMKKKMESGSMSAFDALQIVGKAIEDNKTKTNEVGVVMSAVFGRQGKMAGDNLGKAIAELNTNLEETKRQTGEVGKAYNDLYNANFRLEKALQQTFGYKGWEEMATGIKTKLVGAMADVLECIDKINTKFNTNIVEDYFNGIYEFATKATGPLGEMLRLLIDINKEKAGEAGGGAGLGTAIIGALNNNEPVTQDEITEVVVRGKKHKTTTTPKTEEQLNNENIQKLTQEYIKASDGRRKAIEAEIKGLQQQNKEIQRLKDVALGNIKTDGSLPDLTRQLQDLQKRQSEAADGKEWDSYKEKIQAVTNKITVLKGVLPKDQQATFTVSVNTEQLEQLRMLLSTEDNTVRINVEEGTVNLPEVPTDDQTVKVNITADTAEAMQHVRDMVSNIEGMEVVIEPKIEINEQDLRTPFEKLQDSIRIEIGEKNTDIDNKTLRSLTEVVTKNDISTGTINMQSVLDQTDIYIQSGMSAGESYAKAMQEALTQNIDLSSLQEMIGEGLDIPDETWEKLVEEINKKLKDLNIDPISVDIKTGNISTLKKDSEGIASSMSKAASAISQVSGALSTIEDPAAKIMGIVGEAIATVASAFATALHTDGTTKSNIWAFIGASAASTAAMISMIQSIHDVTGYAQGGEIKGNYYSSDKIGGIVDGSQFVGLNAGEIVLNRAQTSAVAQQLQDGSRGGVSMQPYVNGETIFLGMNNHARKKGYGEIVTTSTLRRYGLI